MLIGNVGKEPTVRYFEGNNPGSQSRKQATFPLATSERYKERNGEIRENTEWHNIVVWGQPADVCEKFVHKGTQLYIEGRIRTRKYMDNSQGVEKFITEIYADTLKLLGRRDNESGYPEGDDPSQDGYQQQRQQGGYQRQGGWQAPQQGQPQGYRPPQPAQPAPAAPQAPEVVDLPDVSNDDLPF